MEKESDKKNNVDLTSKLDVDKEKETQEQEEKVAEPTLEEKLKETHDKLLLTLANSENQRRRSEKETKEAFEYGGFNFARETLSLLDNLQRAHLSIKNDENLKDNKDLNRFLENIQIIEKDLTTIFEKNNIKKIDCLNEKFDPNKHQAMLEIEDENVEPGVVLKEVQPGYFFKDRLLRPSFVAVAKKKEVNNEEYDEKNINTTLVEK
jgi:molecular chaperone GrpE